MHQLYEVQKIGNKFNFPEKIHNINHDVVSETKIRTTRDSIFRHNIKTSLSQTKKPVC